MRANKKRRRLSWAFRPEVELLEHRQVPGSILNNPALAPIALLGFELLEFDGDFGPAWIAEPETASLELLNALGAAQSGGALDDFWSQDGEPGASAGEPGASATGASGALSDPTSSDTPIAPAGDVDADSPWPALGSVGDQLAAAIQVSLALHGFGEPPASAGGGAAGEPGALATGASGAGGSGAESGGGGGSTEPDATPSTAVVHADTNSGWELSVGAALGSTAQTYSVRQPTISIPQLDLHAWSQALRGPGGFGMGFGLRGLAGKALLHPGALARQNGPFDGPARPSGNPFGSLLASGAASARRVGVSTLGVSAPEPGTAGLALAALADQAAANIADTRPALSGVTLHIGEAVQTAGAAVGAVAGNNIVNRLPGLTMTTVNLDPNNPVQHLATSTTFQTSESGTRDFAELAHPNGLAERLISAPARVHDPMTFSDGSTSDSTFHLHAEGDDLGGHFILDESGSTHSVWSEWGDDTSTHWTFDETGSFTATFQYVGQDPITTTVPIDIHQSSDGEGEGEGDESPAGFDLDAFNQVAFYSPDSITSYDLDASGSETYNAHVEGTIVSDGGDSFSFILDDSGGAGFSEDDTGHDTPDEGGGFDETGTFDDDSNGNETNTITITGTLAGGLNVSFSDTITSTYQEHDDGTWEDEGDAGGDGDDDECTDNFDNTASGSDNPNLHIWGPISGDGFTGNLDYTDVVTDNGFTDHEFGFVSEDDDEDDGHENFDDSSHGNEATTLTIDGSIADAETGFAGTVHYLTSAGGAYNNHDAGYEDEDDGASDDTDGVDNFADSDSGSTSTDLLIQGNLSDAESGFVGSILYHPTSSGTYSDSDTGVVNETDEDPDIDSGSDNFDDSDSGTNGLTLTVSGSINNAESGFTGTVSFSDNAGGTYHDHDVGSASDLEGVITETDHFDDGDSGHQDITQSISGSLTDPVSGFSGTLSYSDIVNADYHDSDVGEVSMGANGATGHDHFVVGDGGHDNPSLSINGTLPGGGLLMYSNVVNDTYDEEDVGDYTMVPGGGMESDTLTAHDNGTTNETLYMRSPGFYDEGGAFTVIIDDNVANDTFSLVMDDTGSVTTGAEDRELTADDKGNNRATRTTIKSWSAPGQGWLNSTTVTDWGDDKDHTFSDTILLNGVEISETDNGWWEAKGGHRVDSALAAYGPGDYQGTSSGFSAQTFDDRIEWTDDEITYFRHDMHDFGHGEGTYSGSSDPSSGITYANGNYTSDYDITGHEVRVEGMLTEYVYNRHEWGNSFRHEDRADGYGADTTIQYDKTHNVALAAPGFDITDSGGTNVIISWTPAPPPGASTGGYTPNVNSFHSDNPYDTSPPAQPPTGGGGVGQPGFWESLIPVWGSGRAAIDDLQNGRYGMAAFNAVMAVTDVFAVKAIANVAMKGAAKVGGKVVCRVMDIGCFFAGTLVATESGPKPIESVTVRDRAWSFDLTTGEWRLCSVLETYVNDHIGDMIEIRVADSLIESTYHHPVWVVEGKDLATRPRPDHVVEATEPFATVPGRWVDACDLQIGDVLFLQPDRRAPIEMIAVRQDCGKVYNFDVEELHNYAVGTDRVLVHNSGPCMKSVVQAGKAGEIAGGTAGKKFGIRGPVSGKMRFVDKNTRTALIETKNVASQGWTSQLRDYSAIASAQGKKAHPGTAYSGYA